MLFSLVSIRDVYGDDLTWVRVNSVTFLVITTRLMTELFTIQRILDFIIRKLHNGIGSSKFFFFIKLAHYNFVWCETEKRNEKRNDLTNTQNIIYCF